MVRWCTSKVLNTYSLLSCLYGVPLVYAHGCTPIDVTLSCLYGVPLVYAHGCTPIDVTLSCLYGVPLVYAYGRTGHFHENLENGLKFYSWNFNGTLHVFDRT